MPKLTPVPATYEPYAPSPEIAEKLAVNRMGKLTTSQRLPLIIAGMVSALGMVCPASMLFSITASAIAGGDAIAGVIGWTMWLILWVATLVSFSFLAIVLWVNAKMFLPEAFSTHPVKWVRAPLEIKMAERERTEMPFSYIVGVYSFAPFIAPDEVPLDIGREYIVYYTSRSRLLLSIAPTDQPDSSAWLPAKA
jgi:hypothetical protein